MAFQYPLSLRFKIVAIASQIYVEDANGQEILYVQRKAFKLKEDVRICQDRSQTVELFQMKADRVLDISPHFTVTDNQGALFAGIKREGLRSLWKASYLLEDMQGQVTHHIKEEFPWLKALDILLGELPIICLFTNYLVHPSYLILESGSERPLFRIKKQPAFFEGRFKVEKLTEIPDEKLEMRLILGIMLATMFERARG
jgi:uncharacterized protein YxjI